jgi:AcrR family transcriptional regulator
LAKASAVAKPKSIKSELMEVRRKRILDEAIHLFAEKGFLGTSVDAIAERLGITKPFVYSYFNNKGDLLEAIAAAAGDITLEAIDGALQRPGTWSEKLVEFVRQLCQATVAHQSLIQIYFVERRNLSPAGRTRMKNANKLIKRRLEQLLRGGVATGEFRIENLGLTAQALLGMLAWMYIWYRPSGRDSGDDIAAHFAGLALRMVGAEAPARSRTRRKS